MRKKYNNFAIKNFAYSLLQIIDWHDYIKERRNLGEECNGYAFTWK